MTCDFPNPSRWAAKRCATLVPAQRWFLLAILHLAACVEKQVENAPFNIRYVYRELQVREHRDHEEVQIGRKYR